MTLRDHAGVALAGVVAGLAGGLFGVGGGIVLVPVLTGVYGLTQHQAHGTSLAAIGATALASLVVYALHGNVAWVTAALVGVTSMMAARYGASWAARVSRRGLARAFALLLVAVAVRLLWRTPAGPGAPLAHGWQGAAFDLALGVGVGLLAGFMGVGGGAIAVPAFTLLLGMTQQAAQGTSLAVILVTAPFGAREHWRHGNLVARLVPGLAFGAMLGGPLSSWVAQDLPQLLLTRAFAVFLLLNAARTWYGASRKG